MPTTSRWLRSGESCFGPWMLSPHCMFGRQFPNVHRRTLIARLLRGTTTRLRCFDEIDTGLLDARRDHDGLGIWAPAAEREPLDRFSVSEAPSKRFRRGHFRAARSLNPVNHVPSPALAL